MSDVSIHEISSVFNFSNVVRLHPAWRYLSSAHDTSSTYYYHSTRHQIFTIVYSLSDDYLPIIWILCGVWIYFTARAPRSSHQCTPCQMIIYLLFEFYIRGVWIYLNPVLFVTDTQYYLLLIDWLLHWLLSRRGYYPFLVFYVHGVWQ